MTNISIERPGRGLPTIPRSTKPKPQAPKFLEATVVYTNGRSRVERYERNDANGHKEMDRWAFERNRDAAVDYIAVDFSSRKAQEGGSVR